MRHRRLVAALVLAWLSFCPLASAGVFATCHEDEAAMDCCLPHEGSGPLPLAKVLTAAAPPLAPAVLVEAPSDEPRAVPQWAESAREAGGPRRQSVLSVFLI